MSVRERRNATCWALLWVIAAAGACSGGDGSTASSAVAAVVITTASATLHAGETSHFTAIAVDAHGNDIANPGAVTWASASPSVATVSGNGLVTAAAPGTTSITATIQGVVGTRLMTVLPPSAGAIVTMPGFSFVPFEVSVKKGEDVYFEFPREPHNVIFANAQGAPQDITLPQSNVTISRRFDVAGSFRYDCTLHPGMTGVVTVMP
jgi:plastocyanin